MTEAQKGLKKPIRNRGRILVFTHLKQDEEIETIETHLIEEIESRNKLAENLDDNFLPLDSVELCLLNIHPIGEEPGVTLQNRPLSKVSDLLWSEFISCSAGRPLAICVQALAWKHYNLASTTVTGIPMKEEQTSGSSVNYDVDLLHEKSGHDELARAHYLDSESGLLSDTIYSGYKTLLLKWCSPNVKPQMSVEQLHSTCNAVKVSPAAVNSRPSACLTSFILGGRTVMLELPKKGTTSSANRVISHLLTGHGGHIYLHSVSLGKSALEDVPSISEGPGGRVTDYRITQFGELMKECSLGPGKPGESAEGVEVAKHHLERLTSYWPMTMSESFLFSCQRFEPLLTRLRLTGLSETDLSLCKQVVLGLLNSESLNEPLLGTATHCPKVKGLKRDEQYRLAWRELELHIRNYTHVSRAHFAVLACLLQCLGRPSENFNPKPIKEETKQAAKTPENLKRSISKTEINNKDSPISPGFEIPAKKIKAEFDAASAKTQTQTDNVPLKPTGTINLLDFWIENFEKPKWAKWKDFDRRAELGDKVELYPNLVIKGKQEDTRK